MSKRLRKFLDAIQTTWCGRALLASTISLSPSIQSAKLILHASVNAYRELGGRDLCWLSSRKSLSLLSLSLSLSFPHSLFRSGPCNTMTKLKKNCVAIIVLIIYGILAKNFEILKNQRNDTNFRFDFVITFQSHPRIFWMIELTVSRL